MATHACRPGAINTLNSYGGDDDGGGGGHFLSTLLLLRCHFQTFSHNHFTTAERGVERPLGHGDSAKKRNGKDSGPGSGAAPSQRAHS